MSILLDWLPGLEILDTTHRGRRGAHRRRTFRLTAGPRERRGGPGLLWRLGAAITRRLGGAPACPVCHRKVEERGDWLCAKCGTPLFPGSAPGRRGQWAPRQCPQCGRDLAPDAHYCPQCAVRTRVNRAAIRGERQVRAAKRAAFRGEPAPVPSPKPARKPRKPVAVDAYTRPDGVPVESYTRNKPGEGGQA